MLCFLATVGDDWDCDHMFEIHIRKFVRHFSSQIHVSMILNSVRIE